MRSRRRVQAWLAAGLALAAIGLIPLLANGSALYFWETVAIQMLYATSVNLLLGYAGIPSFGQAAFFGAGAYVAALLGPLGWPVPLVVLAAMLVAGLIAAGSGLITSRVGGLAFSMLTLAIAQALYTLVFHSTFLGGENGFPGLRPAPLGPIDFGDRTVYWFLVVVFVAAGMLAYWVIVRSPFGYALKAIRHNPGRATYLGIDVRRYVVATFVMAGCGGGLAGAIFAFANQIVTPDVLFWTRSGDPIIMGIIGGRHAFLGPMLGAFLYTVLTRQLSEVTSNFMLVIGIVFMFFLVALPEGLVRLPATVAQGVRRVRARQREVEAEP